MEIKRCYTGTCNGLERDAARIKKARNGQNGAKDGYLLVYSEMRVKGGVHRLPDVFKRWAQGLSLHLVHGGMLDDNGSDEKGIPWESGYCLLKTTK